MPYFGKLFKVVSSVSLLILGYSTIFIGNNIENSDVLCCVKQASTYPNVIFYNNFRNIENHDVSANLFCNAVAYKNIVAVSEVLNPNLNTVRIIAKGEFAGAKIIKSKIYSNFYTDARRLGIPASVVDQVVKNLSQKIDFRRSLKVGDRFEVVFDNVSGLLYSKIQTKRRAEAVYKVKSEKAFFYANGEKVSHAKGGNFFGQPLKGRLRITSGFGNRFHPILKRYKFHAGVDLYAANGTPVLAMGDGVVTRASFFAGYGRCVDIKHISGYTSRYAHLSKINVKIGDRVTKGFVVGNVGSSGRSTGHHLHVELARYNKVINPFSVKMIPEEVGRVKNKNAFNRTKKYVENILAVAD